MSDDGNQEPPRSAPTQRIELSPEMLQQIITNAVSAVGNVSAVSDTSAGANSASRDTSTAPMERASRPCIDVGMTDGAWEFFLGEWSMYKRTTGLSGVAIIDQLLYACSDEFRRDLFNMHGKIMYTMSEDILLANMRKLAVQDTNRLVNRSNLWNIKQERGQPVTAYISKLKGQAAICSYNLKCHKCNELNDYSLDIVTDQIIRGLVNTDIQQELLAQGDSLTTHEQVVQYIIGKEAGIRNQAYLSTPVSQLDAQSAYRRQKVTTRSQGISYEVSEKQSSPGCPGCGSKSHGPGTNKPRKIYCPANGKSCNNCKKFNHFASVCRVLKAATGQESKTNALVTSQDSGLSFFMPYLSKNEKMASNPATVIGHLEYDNSLGWIRSQPDDLPCLQVHVQVDMGIQNRFKTQTSGNKCIQRLVPAFADTCAQTTAAGIELIEALGFSSSGLIPTNHRIFTANNTEMELVGAVFLVIRHRDRCANQLCYISKTIKGFFLSTRACIQLGLISDSFPLLSSSIAATTGDNHEKVRAPCGCLARSPPPPIPSSIPFEATVENRMKLQQWILERYKSSAFNTCPHQPLPLMHGPPLKIYLKPNTSPVAVHSPIPAPLHWHSAIRADLERDVALGVIEPVPIGTPTNWCSRAVYVPKKDGSPRRTVDFQALNAASVRQTHHTPSPFQQATRIPPHTKKSVLDAWNGYHSVKLDEASKDATTFITPWGKYRYCTAPQGYLAAGDAFTHRFDEIIKDTKRQTKCVDDTLLWDDTIESAFFHVISFIILCSSNGIVFNPDKFHFSLDEIDFVGFSVGKDGIKPSEQLLSSIQNFPTPNNLTGARSWFGLVNQVSYAFSMKEDMKPFRDLLKPNHQFYWDETLQHLFDRSKEDIVTKVKDGVRTFEIGRPTCLATDWSKDGIGFLLLQKHCLCPARNPTCCQIGWKLILAGSRFTSDAESRYAPVEGEALAVVYALEKARYFVLGCENLVIAVDHAPLVKVLGDQKLENIPNTRLLKLKEKTLMYKYEILHVPGKWHKGPDACSRYPDPSSDSKARRAESFVTTLVSGIRCKSADSSVVDIEVATKMSIIAAFQTGPGLELITWEKLKEATDSDLELRLLRENITQGIPTARGMWPEELGAYWKLREEYSIVDDIIVYKDRVVVPKSLRPEVLEILHAAHQGVVGMKNRARQSVYWPGLNADITQRRQQCIACNKNAPSQPASPATSSESPKYPFQFVCSDYFSHAGYSYVIYVDRYSGWLSVMQCPRDGNDGRTLVDYLRSLFTTFGTPEEVASDGGPQFTSSAVQDFFRIWGVAHRVSSAAFPHSNTRAELGVKTAKRLILNNTGLRGELDTEKFARAILQYRNTPDQDLGLSPAQILYGRHLRDYIPVLPGKYKPRREWIIAAEDRERALANRHAREVDRLNEHTKKLQPLSVGDAVAIQNQMGNHPTKWDKTGLIVEKKDYDQYLIKTDGSGRCTLRNRRFLRKIMPICKIIENVTLHSLNKTPRITDNRSASKEAQLINPSAGERSPMEANEIESTIQQELDASDTIHSSSPLGSITPPRPRRSSRVRVPRQLINMTMKGKSHGITS